MKRGIISLYMEKISKEYKYYFDSNNSESHLTYLLLDRMLSGIKNTKDQVNHLSNKGDRYIDFLIPGLLALGIMNSCLWGTAWTLMDMRSKSFYAVSYQLLSQSQSFYYLTSFRALF